MATKIQGGAATKAVQTSGRKLIGGAAIPIAIVDDDDPRPTLAGAALPLQILEAGDRPMMGGAALPVRIVESAAGPVMEGAAMPAVVVQGSLSPDDWLIGYQYRKEIPITGQVGAGANYQVNLTVHSGLGADSPGIVYLNNHCQDFPNDIRFTDDDGQAELDHWLESEAGGTAYFWIEIADNLDTNQTFYIYYGNSGAASASDGEATFQFFDTDFNLAERDVNNPVLEPAPGVVWDSKHVQRLNVIWNNVEAKFYGYYAGSYPDDLNYQIGLVTSIDLQNWVRFGAVPVIPKGGGGAWDEKEVHPGTILEADADGYKYWLFYTGLSAGGDYAIGLARSNDGEVWTKYGGNPILSKSAPVAWDDDGVGTPAVWKIGANSWEMIYTGFLYSGHNAFGRATASNGKDWTKDTGNNPVFDVGGSGTWDRVNLHDKNPFEHDGNYWLSYIGKTTATPDIRSLGYAYSADFINWTRESNNPAIFSRDDWEIALSYMVYTCGSLVYYDNKYWQFYSIKRQPGVTYQSKIGVAYIDFDEMNKWGQGSLTERGVEVQVVGGEIDIDAAADEAKEIVFASPETYANGFAVEFDGTEIGYYVDATNFFGVSWNTGNVEDWATDDGNMAYFRDTGAVRLLVAGVLKDSVETGLDFTVKREFSVKSLAGNIKIDIDGVNRIDWSGAIPDQSGWMRLVGFGFHQRYDRFRIRKLIATEPSVGTAGTEEEV